jgi:hypothetical protein
MLNEMKSMKNPARSKHVLVVLFLVVVLGCGYSKVRHLDLPLSDFPNSFTSEPFVHPKIIKDLLSWQSDLGDQVVAINLLESQNSNRYFGDIRFHATDKYPFIICDEGTRTTWFGYQYIGKTKSDIHILHTRHSGGGTGRFNHVMFITIKYDTSLRIHHSKVTHDRKRLLIQKLTDIYLGDRWVGELEVQGNELHISRDRGYYQNNMEDIILKIPSL